MMDSAILFKFTRAAPGREDRAFEAFTESMTFFGTAAHDGKCGEPMNIFGTSGLGLMIIPGEYDALWKLLRTEDFRELFTKTVFAVPDISYEVAAFGPGAQELMARWARVGSELAYL